MAEYWYRRNLSMYRSIKPVRLVGIGMHMVYVLSQNIYAVILINSNDQNVKLFKADLYYLERF